MASPLTRVLPSKQARVLGQQRNLETVEDLLWFLPRRHIEPHHQLDDLVEGQYVVFTGTVVSAQTRRMRQRSGTMLNATVRSGHHELDLTFFKAWGHEKALREGASGLFAGKVSVYRGQWQLAHPTYDLGDDAAAADAATVRPLIPVYLQVGSMASWTVATCVEQALEALEESHDIVDAVPPELLAERGLPSVLEAFRAAHVPQTWAERERGRQRLKYDEALLLQLVLGQRRMRAMSSPASPCPPVPGARAHTLLETLPFTLTEGQQAVCREIGADIEQAQPMQRLLQGEVGSGKTVVALWAMLRAIDAGHQAALLAPTEVLAHQHARTITHLLGSMTSLGHSHRVRVRVLTGSAPAQERQRTLLDITSGQVDLVVGTHALIQDHVTFANLALAVVDEQHRFGVEQRDALREQSGSAAHVLVMTATPIPRTVAMTVFGDLEVSALTEIPSGRTPTRTFVVDNPRWYERMLDRLAEEAAAGHQVYVVCSRIGEVPTSERLPPSDESLVIPPLFAQNADGEAQPAEQAEGEPRGVYEVAEQLRERFGQRGQHIPVGVLHGRMSPEEKDAAMARFASGEVPVLVATTIVEVGVDVPGATVMAIVDADRFGVSQLHQLRGRVGRGSAAGICFLVVEDPGPVARERVEAVASTTDGYALAMVDLQQRREGDVLSAQQSGRGRSLRVLNLLRDETLIGKARTDARVVLERDPELAQHPALRQAVATVVDEAQAAYLERG